MASRAVIGLGFGDEGKGVTTEYLASQDPLNTLVVRFSGGHQAGHKVIKNGIEHIFSSFGAGTLSGCPTFWTKKCTLEPVAFMNEYDSLVSKGIHPKVYMSNICPVTTIYDVYANRNSVEMNHGTTGSGFGKTLNRHYGPENLRLYSSTLEWDYKGILRFCMDQIKKYYKIEVDLDVDIFYQACERFNQLIDAGHVILVKNQENITKKFANVVFEGSQGLMLDPKIGYMPHCTPSNLTPSGIYALGYDLDEVFLVTRAYQTRHGNGPMTNEDKPVVLKNNEKETNVYNDYQGKFRTSVLDLDQLIHAKTAGIRQIGEFEKPVKINLVVTCMDQMDEYKVTYGGELITLTDKENYVKLLADGLNVRGSLYMNESPESNLKELK